MEYVVQRFVSMSYRIMWLSWLYAIQGFYVWYIYNSPNSHKRRSYSIIWLFCSEICVVVSTYLSIYNTLIHNTTMHNSLNKKIKWPVWLLKNTLFRDLCICHTGLFVTIQYTTIYYTLQYNTLQYTTLHYNTQYNSLNKKTK